MTAPRLLQRPIYGGVFGRGRYALATVPCVAKGLHSVRFMVIEPSAGAVISVADEKTEALAGARRVIRAADDYTKQAEVAAAIEASQGRLFPDEKPIRVGGPSDAPRSVTRRRREVFERSEGRCHYCKVSLRLDGKWHVEHMMPRALDGADEGVNLVAACAPCNLAKRDRTAIEFMVEQRQSSTTIAKEILTSEQ